MKFTTFNRDLWNLVTFEEIGYDKHSKLLVIYLLDGYRIEFSEVEEEIVFHFITSLDKETFVKNIFLQNYPYIQHNPRVS